MSTVLGNVSTFIESCIGWMGDFLDAILNDSSGVLMTFVVAVPLVGIGIGLLKRLIHVRA